MRRAAVRAAADIAAGGTEEEGGEAPTIQKEEDLFLLRQPLAYRLAQFGRERVSILDLLHVDEADLRERALIDAVFQGQ